MEATSKIESAKKWKWARENEEGKKIGNENLRLSSRFKSITVNKTIQ